MVLGNQTTAIVVTTIQSPTAGVLRISDFAQQKNQKLIIIGDRKSPKFYDIEYGEYLNVTAQKELDYQISKLLPADTYSRKMIGYLLAKESECKWIKETDDDNYPSETFFDEPRGIVSVRTFQTSDRWLNPYFFFSDEYIWPRGFPINRISESFSNPDIKNQAEIEIDLKYSIIQGLADGDPDMDAIFRLTTSIKRDILFEKHKPLLIPRNAFAPFNSQVTTWPIQLLPLMYLPVTCSFRMTDIWRSFIAQYLMPKSFNLIYVGPQVFQVRNEHDLFEDFKQELDGYLGYEKFIELLKDFKPAETLKDLPEVLFDVYTKLINFNYFKSLELVYLEAWLNDLGKWE